MKPPHPPIGQTDGIANTAARDDCEISSEAKIDLPRLYQRAEKVQNRPLLDSEFRNSA